MEKRKQKHYLGQSQNQASLEPLGATGSSNLLSAMTLRKSTATIAIEAFDALLGCNHKRCCSGDIERLVFRRSADTVFHFCQLDFVVAAT